MKKHFYAVFAVTPNGTLTYGMRNSGWSIERINAWYRSEMFKRAGEWPQLLLVKVVDEKTYREYDGTLDFFMNDKSVRDVFTSSIN